MREIKSITVQGLGHWQIGDKIGDGVIHCFVAGSRFNSVAATNSKGVILVDWINMPAMLIYGEP